MGDAEGIEQERRQIRFTARERAVKRSSRSTLAERREPCEARSWVQY